MSSERDMDRKPEPATARPIVGKSHYLGWKQDVEHWLELEQSTLAWGEVLRGCLVIVGSRSPLRLRSNIEACLNFQINDGGGQLVRQGITPGSVLIEPATIHRFPFELGIPTSAPFEHQVLLQVTFSVTRGLWASGCLTYQIKVIPPVACMQIAAQVCMLTDMLLGGWEMSAPGKPRCHFKKGGRRALFAQAVLDLEPLDDAWHGTLSVTGELRGPVHLKRDTLTLPILSQDPRRIREELLRVIEAAGYRTGAGRDLPLPAGPETLQADALPIPAEERE